MSTQAVSTQTALDQLCINTIRTLALDAVQQAKSGHPGLPMGAAPMAYVLWTRFLRHNPRNPKWANRDRFLLSAGHGSMLLYALLYLTGYDLSLDEIKRFRQWGSKTPGHPENVLTPGVEITTGPLGQGFANGVGMAIGQAHLAARFNRPDFPLLDHYIYAIVSDGDLMEGVASEAASLAGHLKLGKLIYLYDNNRVTIDGSTDLAFTEDVVRRFDAYGWHTLTVEDGNDLDAIERAIREAQAVTDRPSLISVHTIIGYGLPTQGTHKAHSDPPGEEAVREAKRRLGWPEDKIFYVPEEALAHFRKAVERGAQLEAEWNALVRDYERAHPELAREWRLFMSGELPEGWERALPSFEDAKPMATRQASGEVINAIAPALPMLIGGSADLTGSNNTEIKSSHDFQAGSYDGRNIHFGVREHAMGACLTGISLNGGLIPFGGTFLVFSDYMKASIRLAALSEVQVIYVFTHDSIGLGEDGPTHQPVEQLAGLRAIPHLYVIRPADPHEVREAWRVAILRRHAPTALALSRQKVPVIDRKRYASAEGLRRGAYVLAEAEDGRGETSMPDLILIATGSEVHLALEAREALQKDGIKTRVVSFPCWELFEDQDETYRDEVLPPQVTARLAIEAGARLGWDRYVGPAGDVLSLDRFGASAPGEVALRELGFNVENVVARARRVLERGQR
ncbi:transketolase [Pyrinomonas methylaliphatogenes]|uniref:Transketolase n=1 Tax=Pyrinomonas methylaliphatogenes TaxID=454194 RepID=A0A0B6WZX5_9BACT|nr:transketolase [Pyrinomonas methylaliphatogenes]CDM65715.1 transketolase [Pyrinomonas methylaliphatogenes]